MLETNKILQGDALHVLKTLQDESINCLMTSPPYWALRDYGTANWEGGDENCDHKAPLVHGKNAKVGNQLKGVTCFYKEVCAKCGAKRVDLQIGLEPTFDLYIKHLCDIFDEAKRVLRKDGTCWVNLGDTYNSGGNYRVDGSSGRGYKYNRTEFGRCKVDTKSQGIPSKCLTLIPMRFAIEMVNRGWILRNVIIWHKPNCMPSSVKDRFTVDFEYLFFFVKNKKYWFETQREEHHSNNIRTAINGKGSGEQSSDKVFGNHPNGRNKRTVWRICPRPFKESHFAVYPEELCETPLKAGCPKGGIVLDPFFGAGTTGLVALKQNKQFIGIELNPEYIKIAEARLKPFLEQRKLGGENKC